jgi:outer membrane protein TolC
MLAALTLLSACDSIRDLDRNTNQALLESAERVGDVASLPVYDPSRFEEGNAFPPAPEKFPPTVNPAATDLLVPSRPAAESDVAQVIERFRSMTEIAADAPVLPFDEAIRYAQGHASEYLAAEEAYFIVALNLLIEQHRWGPRFFNETSAFMSAAPLGGGRYNTAINLLNDLGVSQRLPWGGEVSAQFLVAATEQLSNAIGEDGTQSSTALLSANIPLLRGAGTVAQEPLIQARRNLIYAAREFQTFRRQFYFEIAGDYLDLIFRSQQIRNSEAQVERSRQVEARTVALVDSGRTEPFQADLARQNTLFAIDRLAQLQDDYRLQIDRFKLRIGMDTTKTIRIAESALNLPVPKTTLEQAVQEALDYRLDLQTSADEVEDARRQVDVAKNELQGDLNVRVATGLATSNDLVRGGLDFRPEDTTYSAGLTYGLPLDRTIEEARYRQSQILLERQRRDDRQFRDRAAIEARRSVRGIETAQFSLLISERNVAAAQNRQAAIDAAPDRATARDRTEAVNNLQRAQDQLDTARRDLQIAILGYLLSTGQLRIVPDGALDLPNGLAQAEVGP